MKELVLVLAAGVIAVAGSAHAAIEREVLSYTIDDATYESTLVYDRAAKTAQVAIVAIPNWLGPTEANIKQAERIAARGYIVLLADVYGTTVRPSDFEQAGAAAGALKSDPATLRKRAITALEQLQAAVARLELKTRGYAAIGFCFGGTTALEMARATAPVAAVVSFHGGLATPDPVKTKGALAAKVLVLHGADDPYVPPAEVAAFEAEMRTASADWQLISYGNAVHSFTDVDARMTGQAEYNAVVERRAYRAMDVFFDEVFPDPR